MSPRGIGLLFSVYPFSLLLTSYFFGILSDKWGRRSFMVVGMFCLAAASVNLAISDSVPVLFYSRFFQGIGASATWSVALAWTFDIYPSNKCGAKLGIILTSTGVGSIIGPALGGVLSDKLGYKELFLLSAILPLALSLCFLFLKTKKRIKHVEKIVTGKRLFNDINLITGFSIIVVGILGMGMLEVLVPLHLISKFEISKSLLGGFLGALVLSGVCVQPLSGHFSDRYGRKPFIYGGGMLFIILMPLFAKSSNIVIMFLMGCGIGIGFGLFLAPSFAIITDVFEYSKMENSFGMASGVINVGQSIGLVLGPIIGTMLYEKSGIFIAFLYYSVFFLVSILILYSLNRIYRN